jgi:hypothetical protein
MLSHDLGGSTGAKPATLQVHVDDLVKLLLGHLAHGGVTSDAGVVDHDVERTKAVLGLSDQRLYVLRDGHIADLTDGAVSDGELLGGGSDAFGVQVTEHHAGALSHECLRNSVAEALCATGDYGDASFKQSHDVSLLCPQTEYRRLRHSRPRDDLVDQTPLERPVG